MPATQRSADRFADLTDRELQVLRLLASGHTAKTIAAQLGASEAAINERLRDARRKTGIGSSRELARLLDAQKIWDKNIDLSTERLSDDGAARPAMFGLPRSKGLIMLLIALPLAATGLIVIANPAAHPTRPPIAGGAVAATKSPLAGRWALDVARIPEDERPQRVTITLRAAADNKWTMLVDIVQRDGATSHAESTAAPDGVAVPISGSMAGIDTAALRQPAPNTLVVTLGKGGTPVSTRVYTVAKDRKSMTETIVWAGSNIPKLETTYFNRVD